MRPPFQLRTSAPLTAALAWLLILTAAPGCSLIPSRSYFPLRQGMEWKYHKWEVGADTLTGSGFAPVQSRIASVANLAPDQLADGRRATPQSIDDPGHGGTYREFYLEDEQGIAHVAEQLARQKTPQVSPPSYVIKYPIELGATWEESTSSWLLLRIPVHLKYTIESLDDTVTVPAGIFRHCVRIALQGQGSKYFIGTPAETAVTEAYWLARGVGLVRKVHSESVRSQGRPFGARTIAFESPIDRRLVPVPTTCA